MSCPASTATGCNNSGVPEQNTSSSLGSTVTSCSLVVAWHGGRTCCWCVQAGKTKLELVCSFVINCTSNSCSWLITSLVTEQEYLLRCSEKVVIGHPSDAGDSVHTRIVVTHYTHALVTQYTHTHTHILVTQYTRLVVTHYTHIWVVSTHTHIGDSVHTHTHTN
jgi:hypothetical protein